MCRTHEGDRSHPNEPHAAATATDRQQALPMKFAQRPQGADSAGPIAADPLVPLLHQYGDMQRIPSDWISELAADHTEPFTADLAPRRGPLSR